MEPGNVIVIAGPTAVGKTEMAIRVAQYFSADILSFDSRQFYKSMDIGTAKPSLDERRLVPHHFVDFLEIDQHYSAGDFARDARKYLKKYFQKKSTIIITGGSGLFLKALLYGLQEYSEIPMAFRKEIIERYQQEGIPYLIEELRRLDPVFLASPEAQNPQRLMRALEVSKFSGVPFSTLKTPSMDLLPYFQIKIGLDLPREILYDRINTRVDLMVEAGLIDEVGGLLAYKNHNALNTVGYKEIFNYFSQVITKERAIELIKKNTRNYAKRQLTWFRNQDQFDWFPANDFEGIKDKIESKIR